MWTKNYSASNFFDFSKASAIAIDSIKSPYNCRAHQFTMAAVYKAMSKKQARQQEAEDREPEDAEMEDLIAEADDTSDSDEEEEEEEEAEESPNKQQFSNGFMPKTRVLMLTSRGVTYR